MRDTETISRVAVEAYYDYERRGIIGAGPSDPCFFFCELPTAWIEESDRLWKRLFAICEADLKDICNTVNARELADWSKKWHEQIAWHDRICLRSIQFTCLTFVELQARPWLYTSGGDPFEHSSVKFPRYCAVTDEAGGFSVITSGEFQQRAEEDILQIAALPVNTQKDELALRNVCGESFLYCGDRLITEAGRDSNWSHWASDASESRIYKHLLYRLSERDLVVSKELVQYIDYEPGVSLSRDFFCSADNGASWHTAPDFDTAKLNALSPAV